MVEHLSQVSITPSVNAVAGEVLKSIPASPPKYQIFASFCAKEECSKHIVHRLRIKSLYVYLYVVIN